MIHFRKEWGLYWPDYDMSPQRTFAYVQKHLGDMDMTVTASRAHRVCVQAGGHVGLWPLKLAEHFDRVFTFEPDPALFRCLVKNTAHKQNIVCSQSALGAARGHVKLMPHEKAGSWKVSPHGSHLANVETIDGLLNACGVIHCDAIILDIEGSEVEALKGAQQTIETHRPVVHLEELREHRLASSEHMRSIGYRETNRAGRDALYTFGGDLC